MWTTRDGTEVEVGKMTDSHLQNAIMYCRRHCEGIRLRAAREYCNLNPGEDSEAAYLLESAVEELADMEDDEFLCKHVRGFCELLQEAGRRKFPGFEEFGLHEQEW